MIVFAYSSKNYEKVKILLVAPFYTLFDHRKNTKIYIHQKWVVSKTDVLALEVSQKSISALSCCMALTFFCDPHPAWEHDFRSWWHLCSENAIFFIFSTPPQREAQKSTKSHFEGSVWRHRRGRRETQIGSKSAATPGDCDWDVFFESMKIQHLHSRLCVILKEYQQLQLKRPVANFTNLT